MRLATFVAASAVFMAAVLLLDADGLALQLALGLATGGFLWFFARRTDVDPRQIICAILVATLGEVVLSLGWGLYSYRHALILSDRSSVRTHSGEPEVSAAHDQRLVA